MVLNIGDLPYATYCLDVLRSYCDKYSYTLHVINENKAKAIHPSWLKLLCHDLIKSDFILCWDLDLLPTATAKPIEPYIDYSRLNLCYDSSLLFGNNPFKHFRYNCGLFGIPVSEAGFCKKIFTDNHPGNRPSYEQYYVNDALAARGYPVNELPSIFNSLYPRPECDDRAYFQKAWNKHYTWGVTKDIGLSLIIQHHAAYYGTGEYPS